MSILYAIISSSFLLTISTSLSVFHGANNYSTYHEGDLPIIILSQHGGSLQPTNIPDRLDGCYDGSECHFNHDCDNTWPRDSNECGVITTPDGKTKELAQCLRDEISMNIGGQIRVPHLIINELRRSKLDANREIEEAAQFNTDAISTYNSIHFDFMNKAKNDSLNKCGFGLIFDIHGQSKNNYNQFGYRLTQSELELTNNELNDPTNDLIDETSFEYLILRNSNDYNLSDIVRGINSLGDLLNSSQFGSYLTVPSSNVPHLQSNERYYRGGHSLRIHGSESNSGIDAIQIEVNADIRWNNNKRQLFCEDFADAIISFVNTFYDFNDCNYNINTNGPTIRPTNQPTNQPTKTPTEIPCGFCRPGIFPYSCSKFDYNECQQNYGKCFWWTTPC